MKIFGGSNSLMLAQKIAHHLQIPLSPIDIFTFPDGEKRVRITENVLEEDIYLVHSTSSPVNDNYMELFLILDGLKRSGAATITLIMPYMGYQRQDHIFRDGEAVSLEVMIKILSSLEIDNFISLDLHSSRIPDLFPSKIHVSHLSALELFAQKIKEEKLNTPGTVLVSPDMGGIRRIKILSEMLGGLPFAAVEKNRDLESGSLKEDRLGEGSIKNMSRALIVDDIIASGKTIADCVELLDKLGIKESYTFATHAVFSPTANDTLQNSSVKKVFVTDTISLASAQTFSKLQILSSSALITKEIKSLQEK